MKVERQGVFLLSFTPAMQEQGGYNWSEKQYFSLSAVECGDLLGISPGNKKDINFTHDPNMGGGQEGALTKTLRITPIPDSQDFFFGYATNDMKIVVPVTLAEFRVIQSLVNFSIPKLIGWDAAFDPSLVNRNVPQAPRYQAPTYELPQQQAAPRYQAPQQQQQQQQPQQVPPLKPGSNAEGDWPF